jgi:2'-5' RNA ligase
MSTRESAIDICLPELAELIDQWRLSTIPVAAQGVPPHITLLYPWRTAPLQPGDLNEAAAAVVGITPFTVTFRRVGRFPGVLFLSPEPENVVRILIRRLVRAFPETPPYGGQFGADPTPHLTIAQATTEEELSRLQAEISARLEPVFPLSLPVHALSIEEEGADGRWQISSTIELVGS